MSNDVHFVCGAECFLPTGTYPLTATTIPPNKLFQTQKTVTTVFLIKNGVSQNLSQSSSPMVRGSSGFATLEQKLGCRNAYIYLNISTYRRVSLAG